jgi:RHS repeat-associated protein
MRSAISTGAIVLGSILIPAMARAQAVQLTTPAAGARVTAGAVTFQWQPVAGATSYQLQICWSSGCGGQGLIANVTTGATAHQYTLAGGSFVFSVKAYQNTTLLAQSESRFFWADDFCAGPFLAGDFNGDGRSDRLCSSGGSTRVSLSTTEGFDEPQTWLTQQLVQPLVGDFNGDGFTDLAEFVNTVWGDFYVALSNGQSFEPLTHWGATIASEGGSEYHCRYVYSVAGTGDFNGDGKTDVTCTIPNHPQGSDDKVWVGISTGGSFAFQIAGHALCDEYQDGGTLDFNGDGKSDWYCIGRNNDLALVFPYVNGGFQASVSVGSSCEHLDYMMGDFNGDGRTDFACPPAGHVWLSTGSAYLYQGASSPSCNDAGSTPFAADVDSDGAAEFVCSHASGNIQVRDWNGASFGPEEVWLDYRCQTSTSLGDFNGDGQIDILCDKQRAAVSGIPAVRADLMASATNGIGGVFTPIYEPSSSYPSSDPGASGVRQVVSRLAVSDGRGQTSTTTYSYAGGKADRQERQFLGFSYVRVVPACDTWPCPYVETALSQELASVGRPIAVYRYDGGGAMLAARTNIYQTNGVTVPRTALLARTDDYTWSESDSRHTYATYAYDAYGNVTQTLQAGDADQAGDEVQTTVTAFAHNTGAYIVSLPQQVEQSVPGGALLSRVTYGYDATPPVKGDVLSVSRLLRYPGFADDSATRTTTYFANGNPQTATDETGRAVTTSYETATGYSLFPKTVTNAANEATNLTWDIGCAAIATETDPNGRVTTTTYDPLCRVAQTTFPLGGYVQQSHPDLGNPAAQRRRTDSPPPPGVTGASWAEAYFDGLGRTWKTVSRGPSSSQDIVVETTYGARGLPVEVSEPYYASDTPRITSYEYDALGRVVRVQLPGNREVLTSYEATSQTATDPDGRQATSRFDAYGRVVELERTLNGQPAVTQTTYDPLGRRIGMTDPVGISWTWGYDSLGRLREEWDPDAGHRVYTYDKAGRPLTQVDAKNQTTTFTYNTGGRLATRSNSSGTATLSYSQARTGYYNVGRLTTVALSSPSTTLYLDYDALGRPVKQRRVLDGTTYTLTKSLNPSGYELGTTYPDNDTISGLTYDGAGRLASIPNIVSSISYDALGRPLQRQNANATQTSWSYADPRGFLSQIQTTGSQGTIQNLQYTQYTDAGLLQQVTSPTAGEGWSYEYDDLGHMTMATNLTNSADSQSFTYDAADRILTSSRYGTYTYPSPSQPRPHAPSSVNGVSLSYDLNGNVTQAGTRSLTWNANDRPTQTTLSGLTTTFTYDAAGERLKKTSTQGTFRYPFGDDYEIAGTLVTKYISAEGLGVLAKRVGTGAGAVTYWIHTDRLGSIQAVSNGTGQVVHRRTYRPFGETLTQTGNSESRGWIDQRNDPETGLTYLHARYFDPQLGMFLSPDPSGIEGGLNLYAYGFGDVVNRADRSGLDPDDDRPMPLGYIPSYHSETGPSCSPFPLPGCPGYRHHAAPNPEDIWRQMMADRARALAALNPQGSQFGPNTQTGGSTGGSTGGAGGEGGTGDGGGDGDAGVAAAGAANAGCSAMTVTTSSSDAFGEFVNFSAGFGDVLLLGFGDDLRDALDIGGVNTSSPAYGAGEVTGFVASLATGVAGGVRAAGTRAAGVEFSHWLPARLGGPRTILNGNYVTPFRHSMHDPYRYLKGMKKADKFNPVLQQLDRTPKVLRGAALGATLGAIGRSGAGCS